MRTGGSFSIKTKRWRPSAKSILCKGNVKLSLKLSGRNDCSIYDFAAYSQPKLCQTGYAVQHHLNTQTNKRMHNDSELNERILNERMYNESGYERMASDRTSQDRMIDEQRAHDVVADERMVSECAIEFKRPQAIKGTITVNSKVYPLFLSLRVGMVI